MSESESIEDWNFKHKPSRLHVCPPPRDGEKYLLYIYHHSNEVKSDFGFGAVTKLSLQVTVFSSRDIYQSM